MTHDETLADIEAELRDLSRSEKLYVGAKYSEPQPTVNGKPIGIYFADLADRIKAAAKCELEEREHVAEEHATEHAEAVARDNCRDCLGRDALVMIKQMGIELRNEIPHLDKKWEACLKMAIRIYQTAEDAYLKAGGVGVALDFGRAGVATVHHYEVRETVAGRCNLVATFTDPHRAAEYAERIAREGCAA